MVILTNIRRKYMVGRIPKGATVPMSSCVVTLATDSATYTGSARTVGVTVTWNGATLTANTDYTLSYANNVNLGPATVTVTGMGQFSGSVTKTFYIVDASYAPWSFDLTNATLVGSKSFAALSNVSYILPVVENYDQNGAVVPLHCWVNGKFVSAYSFPLDGNGELHVENINTSSPVYNDGTGAGGAYLHPFYFDKSRSFWFSNDATYVLKSNEGTESPDFSNVISSAFSSSYKPILANNGRVLFVPQAQWKVCEFDLGTAYDISTVDLTSKRETVFLGNTTLYTVNAVLFGARGSQALVSAAYTQGGAGGVVYHVSCPTPYSLEDAVEISSHSFASDLTPVRAISVLNEGRTLVLCGTNRIFEYDLVA